MLPLRVRVVQDLDDEDDEEDEDEAGVEVGDVEGRTQAADERVGAEECGHDQDRVLVRGVLGQRLDGGLACQQHADGDDEVGQDGEEAEDDVRLLPKASVDDL